MTYFGIQSTPRISAYSNLHAQSDNQNLINDCTQKSLNEIKFEKEFIKSIFVQKCIIKIWQIFSHIYTLNSEET